MPEFGEFFNKVTKPVRRFLNPPMIPVQRREAERKATGSLNMADIGDEKDARVKEVQDSLSRSVLGPTFELIAPLNSEMKIYQELAEQENKRDPREIAQDIQIKNQKALENDDKKK